MGCGMDSEAFLVGLAERLFEEILRRVRALEIEVFCREFSLEPSKRGEFRRSANQICHKAYETLRILFGEEPLDEPLAGTVRDFIAEIDSFWHGMCDVVSRAVDGSELGKDFPEEKARMRRTVEMIQVKAAQARSLLTRTLTDGDLPANLSVPE
jgi:hypothetical protein